MSLINVSHLTFAYDGSYDDVFTDVSFQINTDWKLGFCGRNGRGKTTFLKLLMGMYPFGGEITASVDFAYFPVIVEDHSRTTGDILSTVAPDAQDWEIQRELFKLSMGDYTLHRPFSTLSGGEQTKALLAGMFLKENAFLLIDEPTDHLDMAARETVARYLNGKAGFILVSHDRKFLDGCTDHILSINKANIEIQNGNFTSWYTNKQLQDSFEMAENERLQHAVRRLTSTAQEKARWSDRVESTKIGSHQADRGYVGHKAAKMMKRSKAIEKRRQKANEEKSSLLQNIESAVDLKMHPLPYHTSRMIDLDRISVSYGGREVFRDLSFTLERGDRIVLLGGNGAGKSSILKLISGENIPYSGHVAVGSQLRISYVPQDASFLKGSLQAYAKRIGIDETLFMTNLRQMDFSRTQLEKDMDALSAGQKKKILIAASLSMQAHVYLWDEPLNYIDVLSRIQIEDLIASYQPTMLFTEHDQAFCDRLATKTVRIHAFIAG